MLNQLTAAISAPDWTVAAYRTGSTLAQKAPGGVVRRGADLAGRWAATRHDERRFLVERHLRRVCPDASDPEIDRLVGESYRSYARYWADSFRLPALSLATLDRGLSYSGFDHIIQSLSEGNGTIMVVPHLGGWEWAATWLARVEGITVSAVVEAIEPRSLFDWFAEFRRSIGINVIALGSGAGVAVSKAIRDGHIVCLLADRDVGASTVEVELFGETTRMAAGPATLAFRTGATLIPCPVYFRDGGVFADIGRPLIAQRQGRLRDDITALTQDIAHAFEDGIRAAPEQWHLMQPNWPSDYDALREWSNTQGE